MILISVIIVKYQKSEWLQKAVNGDHRKKVTKIAVPISCIKRNTQDNSQKMGKMKMREFRKPGMN